MFNDRTLLTFSSFNLAISCAVLILPRTHYFKVAFSHTLILKSTAMAVPTLNKSLLIVLLDVFTTIIGMEQPKISSTKTKHPV